MSTLEMDSLTRAGLDTERVPLVRAQNLGVYYEGDKGRRDDFKSHVHGVFQAGVKRQQEVFWALNDITFEAYAGDVLGIIGSNGAGKSTLCRVVSGLLRPNRGSIDIKGNVSALLSLGTGFNTELSGNDNILLNGMMLGLSRKRIKELLPAIQEFSGLGNFLEQPIKHYSSGMRARLGFSIASSLEAEILVIDEVLGTGDMEFRERAVEKLWDLVGGAKLVMVVTHSTDFVQENCNRAIWIEKGEVKSSGEPEEVINAYKEFVSLNAAPRKRKKKIVQIGSTNAEAGNQKAITVENLGIKFKVNKKPFWALKDISFNLYDKEILGIIGHNGAGKSTLCRALCGIYREDTGRIGVNGEIAALLSFGTGFNAQLSGYDNIYLNGMMLGIPRQIIRKIEDDIIEFSGLEKAIHKPVKQYSKGMKSRLGFSIASMLQPDIFIVDEALSAGDLNFQEKATARMQEMLEDAKAVVIVTHSMNFVKKVCTRALLLKEGKMLFDGEPKEAVDIYQASVKKKKKNKRL